MNYNFCSFHIGNMKKASEVSPENFKYMFIRYVVNQMCIIGILILINVFVLTQSIEDIFLMFRLQQEEYIYCQSIGYKNINIIEH